MHRLTAERAGRSGWWPWQVWSVVAECGHRQEVIPVLQADGLLALIPVLGEAR